MDMDNSVGVDCGSGSWAGQRRANGGNWDNCNRITIIKKKSSYARDFSSERWGQELVAILPQVVISFPASCSGKMVGLDFVRSCPTR